MQDAINPKPNAQTIAKRLNMNIGGARFQGIREEIIDEPDNRRFAGEIFQILAVAKIIVLYHAMA